MPEPIDVRHLMSDLGVGRFTLDPSAVVGIAGHHSVSATFYQVLPDESEAAELGHLLDIDNMHQALGWGGFGYHLAAFASRRLYLCGSLNGARAHVASRNHELIGIVLIGDFSTIPPTPAHIETAAAGVEYIRRIYPGRHLAPHRAWALPGYATSCPGNTWAEWMPALNSPPQEEDDMPKMRFVQGSTGPIWVTDGILKMGVTTEQIRTDLVNLGLAENPADGKPAHPVADEFIDWLRNYTLEHSG